MMLKFLMTVAALAAGATTTTSAADSSANNLRRVASAAAEAPALSRSVYAVAYEMADLSDRAYGSLGIFAGFFFIPNNKIDLKGTRYTLRKTYNIDSDFGFTAHSDDACVVAFRGSDQLTPSDWISNFEASGVPFRKLATANKNSSTADIMAYVHEGDLKGYQKFYLNETTGFLKDVADCMKRSPETKLYLTGHSRGGAMAAIMAVQMRFDEGLDAYGDFSRLRKPMSEYLQVYTIGENRNLIAKDPTSTSSGSLAAITQGITKYRFVNKRDLVPSVPTFSFNKKELGGAPFVHWGTPVHHAGDNKVESVNNDFPTHLNETLNLIDHIPSSYKSFLLAASKV